MRSEFKTSHFFAFYVLLLGVVLTLGMLLPRWTNVDAGVLGQFGDFFGGMLNPMIGGLGLGGVVMAIKTEARRKSEILENQIDQQKKHRESLEVSSAIGMLQLFVSAAESARSRSGDDDGVRRNLIQGVDSLQEQILVSLCETNAARWGGAARLLSLLFHLTRNMLHGNGVVQSAMATLSAEELELILVEICRTQPTLALELCEHEKRRITIEFEKVLISLKNRTNKELK